MNSEMAVGTDMIQAKTRVKSRYRSVTAVTKLALALEGKHVPVGRAMGVMAGRTALYESGTVLEHVGTAFTGVTLCALSLLEPTQGQACLRLMGVVAGDAVQDAFLKPVLLIELKLGENVAMTLPARGCRSLTLKRTPVIGDSLLQRHDPGACPAQNIVAACTIHA